MGFLFVIILAALGAALLIGGIIGYRKFNSALAKTISAAAAAAGLAILVFIILVTPVSRSSQ